MSNTAPGPGGQGQMEQMSNRMKGMAKNNCRNSIETGRGIFARQTMTNPPDMTRPPPTHPDYCRNSIETGRGIFARQTMTNPPDMTRPPPTHAGLLVNVPQQHQQHQLHSRPQCPQVHEQGETEMNIVGGERLGFQADRQPYMRRGGFTGNQETREYHRAHRHAGEQPYLRGYSHDQQWGPNDRLLPTSGNGDLGKRPHGENQNCPSGRDLKKPYRRDHDHNVRSFKPRNRKDSGLLVNVPQQHQQHQLHSRPQCPQVHEQGETEMNIVGGERLGFQADMQPYMRRGGFTGNQDTREYHRAHRHAGEQPYQRGYSHDQQWGPNDRLLPTSGNGDLGKRPHGENQNCPSGRDLKKPYRRDHDHNVRSFKPRNRKDSEFCEKFDLFINQFGVIDKQKPMDIPNIIVNFHIRGKDPRVVQLAEDTLFELIQNCMKKNIGPNDVESIKHAVKNFLDDLEKDDAKVESVEKGSIILNIKCPTLLSLENILSLLRMDHNRWRELEKALSEKFQAQMEVDLVLTANTIEMLSIWIGPGSHEVKGATGGATPNTAVRSPEYTDLSARLRSFDSGWSRNMSQSPLEVAEAGFYYTGEGDVCRCFTCDGGLARWDPQDDPWVDHAKWFPQCTFVRQTRGDEYVNLIQQAIADSDDEDPSNDAATTLSCMTVNPPGDMPCTRTLSMGIQCHSAEAVTKVVNYFHSEESTNRLNQLSEALSGVIQDEVMVDVQLDTKGFLEAFKTSYETKTMNPELAKHDTEEKKKDVIWGQERRRHRGLMASDKQKRHNWIKASLSLLYLKEVLAEELDDHAIQFHFNIKQIVAAKCTTAVTAPKCTNCTSRSIKRAKKLTSAGTFWYINCPNNVCNHWLDTLIQYHEHMPGPNVEWANCDPTLWASQPWEVAKVFQPVGCQQQRNAEESDVAGLLTLVLKCKFFHKLVSNTQILQEIKECRNKIMHSATLEVDDTDMKDWLDLMIALLEDNKHLGKLSSCKSAAGRIRELRDKSIEISFDKEDENKALGLQIDTLSAEVSNIQRESDDIKCHIRDLTSKHQSSSEESNHIRIKLSTSVTTVSELKEQMETLQKTFRVSDIPHVKARLSDIQQRLQSLSEQNEEDTRSIFAKFGDFECKMDIMQHQLKSHEEQIGSLPKDSDKDIVGHIRDYLISLYNKNYQTMPIYPLRPDWREHVEGLYVKPNMVEINLRGVDLEHTQNMAGLCSRDNRETKVEYIRSIFYKGDTLCTDICVVGESGSGKSVLCQYLVHLWVKCHSPSSQPVGNFMKNFKFLFYISLQNAESCNVESIIRDQLKIPHAEDISKLLSENTWLLILDGLDEFKPSSKPSRFQSQNIPTRHQGPKSTYLTTSRPWKIELLRREFENKLDRHIRILGMEGKEQKQLAMNVLELLNHDKGQNKTVKDFFKYVTNQNLSNQLESPVLLMQMLGLWFSGQLFGRSQCYIYSRTVEMQLQFTEEIKCISVDQTHLKTETETQVQLPACFKDFSFCQKYKSLLLKLSKLANQQLFSKNRKATLVFDHGQMEISDMSETEITLCLKLGLLTQEITERRKSVSFVHKSHQEFFAAIFWSQTSIDSDLKQLFEGCYDLDHNLEIEKVFTFVSGMNPSVSCKIAKAIMKHVNIDSRVQQYRESCADCDAPYENLVKRIQGVILAGIEEGKKNDVNALPLLLQDIWMKNGDREFPPSRIFACKTAVDLSHIKSIFIYETRDISRDEVWRLFKASLPHLQKLVLRGCDISVERVKKVVRRNGGDLQAMGLDNVDFSRLSQEDLQQILAAPNKSLGLTKVRLTHAQMGFLCRHLSIRSFTELHLDRLDCTEHGTSGKCLSLDLMGSRDINRLELDRLPLQNVAFHPERLVTCRIAYLSETVTADATRCLYRADQLEVVRCAGYAASALVELSRTLPSLTNLRQTYLSSADLRGHEHLLVSPDQNKLEYISLLNVTLTAEHLRRLLASLPPHGMKVYLGDSEDTVTITGDTTNVIKEICASPDIYVTKKGVVKREGDTCIVQDYDFYTKK